MGRNMFWQQKVQAQVLSFSSAASGGLNGFRVVLAHLPIIQPCGEVGSRMYDTVANIWIVPLEYDLLRVVREVSLKASQEDVHQGCVVRAGTRSAIIQPSIG